MKNELTYILMGLGGVLLSMIVVLIWKGFAFIKSSPLVYIVPVALVLLAAFLTASPYFIAGVMFFGGALLVFATINNKK